MPAKDLVLAVAEGNPAKIRIRASLTAAEKLRNLRLAVEERPFQGRVACSKSLRASAPVVPFLGKLSFSALCSAMSRTLANYPH
jgi:hypothetical protein